MESAHITIKELVPVVLMAAVWGKEWVGQTVQAHCDNAAVVETLNSETSRNAEVMHLVRCLLFLKAKWEFVLFASHIPRVANDLADALSRDNVSHFLRYYPQALPTPAHLPQQLLDLTIIVSVDKVVNPSVVKIQIKPSKNDQFGDEWWCMSDNDLQYPSYTRYIAFCVSNAFKRGAKRVYYKRKRV